MKRSLINFYHYEFVWSYLKDFIEWFNSKYSLKIELEPFLFGEYDIVGFYLDNGLIVFVYLDIYQNEKYLIKDDSLKKDVARVSINPNNPFSFKELEMLIFDLNRKFYRYRGIN